MPKSFIDDLFAEFDLACDFPWTEGSFAELHRYVRAVCDFLPHSSAQRSVRLRARLNMTADPVERGEFESELIEVEYDASTVLPRLVWGGVLVAIYGSLEFGINQTFKHWHQTVSYHSTFKKKRSENFLVSAEAYAKQHLNLKLFPSEAHRAKLLDLSALRNSFAHDGCLLVKLQAGVADVVRAKAHPGVAFEISDGQWISNKDAALHYLNLAGNTLSLFGNAVLEKCLVHNRTHLQ
jgi:hypothetical protein